MRRKELTTVVPEPHQDEAIQLEVTLPLRQRRRPSGPNGETNSVSNPVSRPQIPRITRLMALAIRFQDMVDCGEVQDYADLARLGYVTRARVTQIMNLLLLAPKIQESLLDCASASFVPAPSETEVRSVTKIELWEAQQAEFDRVLGLTPSSHRDARR